MKNANLPQENGQLLLLETLNGLSDPLAIAANSDTTIEADLNLGGLGAAKVKTDIQVSGVLTLGAIVLGGAIAAFTPQND